MFSTTDALRWRALPDHVKELARRYFQTYPEEIWSTKYTDPLASPPPELEPAAVVTSEGVKVIDRRSGKGPDITTG